MPVYSFRDLNTNETFDDSMSISAKEEYLKDNPHIVQEIFHSAIPQGDPFRLGIRKPDQGFKDILKNIKKTHKSTITNLGSKHV